MCVEGKLRAWHFHGMDQRRRGSESFFCSSPNYLLVLLMMLIPHSIMSSSKNVHNERQKDNNVERRWPLKWRLSRISSMKLMVYSISITRSVPLHYYWMRYLISISQRRHVQCSIIHLVQYFRFVFFLTCIILDNQKSMHSCPAGMG